MRGATGTPSWLALVLATLLLALPACGPGPSSPPSARTGEGSGLRVAASINLFADLVRNVGGERVRVDAVVPPGADVHTFDLTPQNLQALTAARLVVVNGADLEPRLEQAARGNLAQGARLVQLFESVPADQRLTGGEGAERPGTTNPNAGVNPHAWLDPRLGSRYVAAIRDALVEADPDGRATYEANAARYTDAIADADQQAEQQLAGIPAARRKLVTFHDAFPYLARRYGLTLVGVVVEAPDREPSAGELAALSRRIQAEAVPAVFSEPQINARTLELIARDTGVRVLPLYSDALDATVPSYLDLLRFNARQLAEGLR